MSYAYVGALFVVTTMILYLYRGCDLVLANILRRARWRGAAAGCSGRGSNFIHGSGTAILGAKEDWLYPVILLYDTVCAVYGTGVQGEEEQSPIPCLSFVRYIKLLCALDIFGLIFSRAVHPVTAGP